MIKTSVADRHQDALSVVACLVQRRKVIHLLLLVAHERIGLFGGKVLFGFPFLPAGGVLLGHIRTVPRHLDSIDET